MEPRNYQSGAVATIPTKPETPSFGYPRSKDEGTGAPATVPGPFFYYKLNEELRNIIVGAGLTPSDDELDQIFQAMQLMLAAVPSGTIMDFPGDTAPTGWLIVPIAPTLLVRAIYDGIWDAVGEKWGAGDGLTTFGMPWSPANYAFVQSDGNVGTQTVGENLEHDHSYGAVQTRVNDSDIWETYFKHGSSYQTGLSGGPANLAAGVRMLKCIKI